VLDVREYLDIAGRSPFTKWLSALNVQAAAKVATALERIADGNMSNAKSVGAGVLAAPRSASRTTFAKPGRIGWTIGAEGPRRKAMPLTKDFRETIRERAQQEPQFRKALLHEAIELMLSGDEKTGRAILRNYINATVGFRQLEEATSIPANSLMRMFGPKGNPSAKNLFGILAHLQAREGVNFEIRPRRG
jgi:hypothetical protein